MASFDDISKQIKDAFPSGKALPVYDRGFRDSMESMVLAMRAFRVSPSVVQDVVTTALNAFATNARDGGIDKNVTHQSQAAAKTDLFVKTDATGVLFFQALQDQCRLGIALDKEKIGLAMGAIIASDISVAKKEIASSRLHFLNYVGLVEMAMTHFHYEYLTHFKPSKQSTGTALVDSVGLDYASGVNTTAKIADFLAKRFDYINSANDPSVNRMWLARLSNDLPLAYEWGIAPGLVGVAMPDEIFGHFAEQAALRAHKVDMVELDQPEAGEAGEVSAPGQGG